MPNTMYSRPQTAADRLIVALDVNSALEARQIVHRLSPTVNFYKVGLQLFFRTQFAFIKDLLDEQKRVFLDLKIEDIPTTLQLAIQDHPQIDIIELMTLNGVSQLATAAKSANGKRKTKFLMLTALSSSDDADMRELYGEDASIDKIVRYRTEKALKAGCDGVIASGETVRKIREWFPQERFGQFLVVAPGIRPAGSSTDDHKRTLTPAQAIKDGADFIVVGRPVTHQKPDDQLPAAERIVAEMQEALHARDSQPGGPTIARAATSLAY